MIIHNDNSFKMSMPQNLFVKDSIETIIVFMKQLEPSNNEE